MIGALWTGISGLSSHQAALDNESHNIANVNTVGYKSSRISFADQMYQDRIGKGSKILDAEKLYVQGNLKLTGVDYDMAISGDGFFTVKNTTASGSGENYYTRAGNFRMGDNGTLQDAAGNEVQGWAMRTIDTQNDVVSTNPNNKTFTSDYTKLLTSKVIKHSNYIETITAKATDYSQTSKADSDTVYEGAGGKSKAAKISDVESLVANYSTWLQKLQDEPDGGSASSIAQISQLNFKSGADGLISKEGDQVYAYINGNKISQNYISTTASQNFIDSLETAASTLTGSGTMSITNTIETPIADNTRYEMEINGSMVYYESDSDATIEEVLNGLESAVNANDDLLGFTITKDPANRTIQLDHGSNITATERTFSSTVPVDLDIAASRIATYRALADQISEIPGLRAYMVDERNSNTGNNDVLETGQNGDIFSLSTDTTDMIKGILQIESLIPGEVFEISEVGEISGSNTVAGDFQTTTLASAGEGVGALESARDALARAITGNQRDVYTTADLGLEVPNLRNDFTYSITIFDKELDKIIPVPNDNGTPPQPIDIDLNDVGSVQDFVDKFNTQAQNSTPLLADYVEALNINGNVVIQTKDDNYDVEFSGNLKGAVPFYLDTTSGISNTPGDTADAATSNLDLSSFVFDGSKTFQYRYDIGAGPQTLNIPNTDTNSITQLANYIETNIPAIGQVAVSGNSIVVSPLSMTDDFTQSEIEDTTTAITGSNTVHDLENMSTSALDTTGLTIDGGDIAYSFVLNGITTTGTFTSPDSDNLANLSAAIGALSPNITASVGGSTVTVTAANANESFTSFSLTHTDATTTSGVNTAYDPADASTSDIDLSTFTFGAGKTFEYSYDIGGTTGTVSISDPANINAIAAAIQADANIGTVTVSGTTITVGAASMTDDFAVSDFEDTTAGTVGTNVVHDLADDTTSTIDGTALVFPSTENFTYYYETAAGDTESVVINAPVDLNDFATQLQNDTSILSATVTGTNIVITPVDGTDSITSAFLISDLATSMLPLDKNNDYSGRQGAGAEFIELVNTIDQTTTQGSLQLKLDTLGISDSAFGEFSVDSTGLITMKQDGAEFAIGQVSIALFNNTRGLDPSGDNLLGKTNESGEPIYNLNNDKTAKIEGKTLELSTADLSESLVNLMVFQRAFEANAKSITTSDQLLNTLINLKR